MRSAGIARGPPQAAAGARSRSRCRHGSPAPRRRPAAMSRTGSRPRGRRCGSIGASGPPARRSPTTTARSAGLRFIAGGPIRNIAFHRPMLEFEDAHGMWRAAVVDLAAQEERLRILVPKTQPEARNLSDACQKVACETWHEEEAETHD